MYNYLILGYLQLNHVKTFFLAGIGESIVNATSCAVAIAKVQARKMPSSGK